ncbi:MAG: nucleotidyltransferase family protein [Eubacterium sp.]|jgi:predicted nucleotidyltransferase|nr:nucleotidyltransferase family protein [Eubacterium sp.]
MELGAVICEYNPFHNGHKYHVDETKKRYGITHMVAVMSGGFTQRGDVAVFDKWQRSEAAIKNGIDLVIELPVSYSLASAEQFAMGAVTLLNKLGGIKYLSFGSECGNIDLLSETAGAVHYVSEQEEFRALLRRGESYPKALQTAVSRFYEDDVANTLASPNNTLGIEYLKAINETGSFIKPVTIKRKGITHDSDTGSEGVTSALKLRKMIASGEDTTEFLPYSYSGDHAFIDRIETAVLSKLRTLTPDDLIKVPNAQSGLENRIFRAAQRAKSLNELFFLTKTKAFTMARIRRVILNAFLGIRKIKDLPAYIRVLGMNSRGKEILSAVNPELPVDTSLFALSKNSASARRQANLENFCGNQYALCFKTPLPCGLDFTHKPVIL